MIHYRPTAALFPQDSILHHDLVQGLRVLLHLEFEVTVLRSGGIYFLYCLISQERNCDTNFGIPPFQMKLKLSFSLVELPPI